MIETEYTVKLDFGDDKPYLKLELLDGKPNDILLCIKARTLGLVGNELASLSINLTMAEASELARALRTMVYVAGEMPNDPE